MPNGPANFPFFRLACGCGLMASKDNDSRRTIAVDFDGVIADYDGYKGPGVLGAPRPDVREALALLRVEGWIEISELDFAEVLMLELWKPGQTG